MKNGYSKFLIVSAFILFISCKDKKENENLAVSNIVVVKKIKSDYLNKIRTAHVFNEKIHFAEADTIVELIDQTDRYIETRRRKAESIYDFFVYDKRNNLMIASGTKLYRVGINIFRKYNKNGRVIEERDTNKGFTFSVYDLINKIKKTHNIDLNDGKENRSVLRGFDDKLNKLVYNIRYDQNNVLYKYITVDGTTGAILASGKGQLSE
jgi:hypothetical protein